MKSLLKKRRALIQLFNNYLFVLLKTWFKSWIALTNSSNLFSIRCKRNQATKIGNPRLPMTSTITDSHSGFVSK